MLNYNIETTCRTRCIAAYVFVLIIMAALCPDASATGPQDTLRMIFWQTPNELTPYMSGGEKDINVIRIIYEPLATFNKEGRLVSVLAAEIPSRENGGAALDGKSVTWKLKPGVKWSDGRPLTAEDVRFTYEYITHPKTEAQYVRFYETIERVEVIDELTAKIHFKKVTPEWFDTFVGKHGIIIPAHVFKPHITDIRNASVKPVGTGAYKLTGFKKEDMLLIGDDLVSTVKIVLEPNPLFRERSNVFFNKIEIHGGGDAKTAARSVVKDGIADYAWNLQLDKKTLSAIGKADKGRIAAIPKPFLEIIFFNHTDPDRETETGERSSLQFPHPFFSDKRVRLAFSHAIPRAKIASLYGDAAAPTTNALVTPPAYNSPNTKQMYPFDLKRAADLLDEAGWKDSDGDGIRDKQGKKMRILFQTSVNSLRQQTQEIVKDTLKQIGIEVKLKAVDAGIFFPPDANNPNNIHHFQADLQEYYVGFSTPAVTSYMQRWTCRDIPQRYNNWTRANTGRWCNPAYDAMYEQAVNEVNPKKRRDLFIRMNDFIIEDAAFIPLFRRSVLSAVSNTLTGIDFTPWDTDTWNIQEWRRK